MIAEQTTHMPTDLVELGRVVSAYGVKGWIKVQPHSSQAEVLLQARTWWIKAPVPVSQGAGAFARSPGQSAGSVSGLMRAAQVLAARTHAATVIAQIDLAPDREAAETFKASTVWVSRSQFPATEDDEYYWVDLIDCQLFGEHDGASVFIGIVQDVVDNGAHAVLRVARASVSSDGQVDLLRSAKGHTQDVLVPFVKAHVHTVDLANKRLESNWPVEF